MKLIFLDFDGVLNSKKYFNSLQNKDADDKLVLIEYDNHIDPEAIELINQLVEQTNAKVIVSSSWRILHDVASLDSILKRSGARFDVMDSTPRLYEERGIEIQTYLNYLQSKGDTVESFVIIDDDSDMAHFINTDNFIKTSFDFGFTDLHLNKAIKVLKGNR